MCLSANELMIMLFVHGPCISISFLCCFVALISILHENDTSLPVSLAHRGGGGGGDPYPYRRREKGVACQGDQARWNGRRRCPVLGKLAQQLCQEQRQQPEACLDEHGPADPRAHAESYADRHFYSHAWNSVSYAES